MEAVWDYMKNVQPICGYVSKCRQPALILLKLTVTVDRRSMSCMRQRFSFFFLFSFVCSVCISSDLKVFFLHSSMAFTLFVGDWFVCPLWLKRTLFIQQQKSKQLYSELIEAHLTRKHPNYINRLTKNLLTFWKVFLEETCLRMIFDVRYNLFVEF